ncbi:MAG: DEAD/DEAH box helicase [Pontimonas sp.]
MKSIVAQAMKELTQHIKAGPPGSQMKETVTFFQKDTMGLWVPVQYLCSNDQWVAKDLRPSPASLNAAFTGSLRDAQSDVCKRALNTIRSVSGTTLVLPTGFGKTVCALYLMTQLGVKPLILVHKSFLLEQWKQRIESFLPGIRVTTIQGATYDDSGDIVIAMMQTMYSRSLSAPDSCGLTIVDECHHVPAKTFRSVMMQCNTQYRIGLSATPHRADDLDPFLILGQPTELAAQLPEASGRHGWSSPGQQGIDGSRIKIQIYEYHCMEYNRPPPIVSYTRNVNHSAMLTQVACDQYRTRSICQMIKHQDTARNILCLVHRKSHATDVFDGLSKLGVDCAIFSPASKGVCPETRIVISTYVFASEGFDEKRFDTLVLCSPATDVRQAVGRILRKMEDPRHDPLVIDVVDNWAVFNRQAFKRRTIYRSMGCTFLTKRRLSDAATQTTMFRQES